MKLITRWQGDIYATKKLDLEKAQALKQNMRREIDESLLPEINYVDEIRCSLSGKHRFVISNIRHERQSEFACRFITAAAASHSC